MSLDDYRNVSLVCVAMKMKFVDVVSASATMLLNHVSV